MFSFLVYAPAVLAEKPELGREVNPKTINFNQKTSTLNNKPVRARFNTNEPNRGRSQYSDNGNTEVEPPTKTTTIQTAIANKSSIFKFIPGWGESVFILLVISPFLLLGIKRQLHR